jgi:hypothetical protein
VWKERSAAACLHSYNSAAEVHAVEAFNIESVFVLLMQLHHL